MYHYSPNQPAPRHAEAVQLQHAGAMGQFNWIEAVSDPDAIIAKYKDVAIKEGTRLGILLIVGLVLLNAVTTSIVVGNRMKKG